MPRSLYVCLQDEDKIAPFTIDADSARLTPQAAVPVQGGPAFLALGRDRRVLYVGASRAQTLLILAVHTDHANRVAGLLKRDGVLYDLVS